jgi:hypothetical protein
VAAQLVASRAVLSSTELVSNKGKKKGKHHPISDITFDYSSTLKMEAI